MKVEHHERQTHPSPVAHSLDDWQRALLRLDASEALETTDAAILVEHDAGPNELLRVHAPAGTSVEQVREAVVAAAVALGVMR
jgi:hypothetical protein